MPWAMEPALPILVTIERKLSGACYYTGPLVLMWEPDSDSAAARWTGGLVEGGAGGVRCCKPREEIHMYVLKSGRALRSVRTSRFVVARAG